MAPSRVSRLACAVQELRHVHAHDGRRDQTKIGENRVPPPDVWPAEEDAPKAVAFRNLLQRAAEIKAKPARVLRFDRIREDQRVMAEDEAGQS